MSCPSSEKAPSCCLPCCPCPLPTTLKARFSQESGPTCSNLEGLEVTLSSIPDAGDCPDFWKQDPWAEVGAGIIELELRCAGDDGYELLAFYDYLFDPNQYGKTVVLADRVVCDPFHLEFLMAADEYPMCDTETGVFPIFRITIEEA